MGLTLVKQLVDMHGGSVEARSAGLGQGSEFIVRLPLLQAQVPAPAPAPEGSLGAAWRADAAALPAALASEGGDPASPPGGCRVLLVDDNRDAVESLAVLLRMAGHEVCTAFDGHEALALAERCRPRLVVLDVGLPGLDGYQVARRLRGSQGTAHAMLVALTGYGQPDDVARAQAAGFDHHFVKPVDPQAILSLAGSPAEGISPQIVHG